MLEIRTFVADDRPALVELFARAGRGCRVRTERITAAVGKHRLILRPGPVRFFARSLLDVAGAKVRRQELAGELDDRRWPAHLHINVVAEVRGDRCRTRLDARLARPASGDGLAGCYLQTVVENGRPCDSSNAWASAGTGRQRSFPACATKAPRWAN